MGWFDDPDSEASESKGSWWSPENDSGGSSSGGGCVVLIAAAMSAVGALGWAVFEAVSRLTA